MLFAIFLVSLGVSSHHLNSKKGTILLFKTTRYVGVETVSCCLLPRMMGMEMH